MLQYHHSFISHKEQPTCCLSTHCIMFASQSVRQHALSMLTDAIIDRHGMYLQDKDMCNIFTDICIPLAGDRMKDLLEASARPDACAEEILIELEMCISLIFKPFLHHLKRLLALNDDFVNIWVSMLGVMTLLLGEDMAPPEDGDELTQERLLWSTKEVGSEHLRSSILVLAACGTLKSPDAGEISALTWNSIDDMAFCEKYVSDWKDAVTPAGDDNNGEIAVV